MKSIFQGQTSEKEKIPAQKIISLLEKKSELLDISIQNQRNITEALKSYSAEEFITLFNRTGDIILDLLPPSLKENEKFVLSVLGEIKTENNYLFKVADKNFIKNPAFIKKLAHRCPNLLKTLASPKNQNSYPEFKNFLNSKEIAHIVLKKNCAAFLYLNPKLKDELFTFALRYALNQGEFGDRLDQIFYGLDLNNFSEDKICKLLQASPFIYRYLNENNKKDETINRAYIQSVTNLKYLVVEKNDAEWKIYQNKFLENMPKIMEIYLINNQINNKNSSIAFLFEKQKIFSKHINEKMLAEICQEIEKDETSHNEEILKKIINITRTSLDISAVSIHLGSLLPGYIEARAEKNLWALNIHYDQLNYLVAEQLMQLFELIDAGVEVYLIVPEAHDVKMNANRGMAALAIINSRLLGLEKNFAIKKLMLSPALKKILKLIHNKENTLQKTVQLLEKDLKAPSFSTNKEISDYYNYLLDLVKVGLDTFGKNQKIETPKPVEIKEKNTEELPKGFKIPQIKESDFYPLLEIFSKTSPDVINTFSKCISLLDKMRILKNMPEKSQSLQEKKLDFGNAKIQFLTTLDKKTVNKDLKNIIEQEADSFFLDYINQRGSICYAEMSKEIDSNKHSFEKDEDHALKKTSRFVFESLKKISKCKYNLISNINVPKNIKDLCDFYKIHPLIFKYTIDGKPLSYEAINIALNKAKEMQALLISICSIIKEGHDLSEGIASIKDDIKKTEESGYFSEKQILEDRENAKKQYDILEEKLEEKRNEIMKKFASFEYYGLTPLFLVGDIAKDFLDKNLIKKRGKVSFTLDIVLKTIEDFHQESKSAIKLTKAKDKE